MDQSEPTGEPGTPTPPATPPPTTGWSAPPPPVQAGPAGFVYADVPNRAIAYIIDAIIVGIVTAIITGVFGSGVTFTAAGAFEINYVTLLIAAVISAAINAAYFIYTWTSMRGTLGMKALGMQIGNAGDGKTLTIDQGVRRWLALAAPGFLAQILIVIPAVGALVGLLALGWFIYLLWTTYSSPTKQGFHDKFANTMVVKAARSAG
ncbi:MAG: RDD family protein [Candidatus Limnocylindrales bacterium]